MNGGLWFEYDTWFTVSTCSSYPIGRFILPRLLYCGSNCRNYCHSNKDLQRYSLKITTVKYFQGGGESC